MQKLDKTKLIDKMGGKRLNNEEFIQRSKKVHGDKFDYSKVKYINYDTKVEIICKIHGSFWQLPGNHYDLKHGCPVCSGNIKYTTEIFIKKANLKHNNKYDYSNVNYKDAHVKVKIICPKHGLFWQLPGNHLFKQGCPKCASIKNANKRRFTTEEFIQKAKKVHGDKYDYSLVEYNSTNNKVKIICPKHGVFEQIPINHIYASNGCSKCASTELGKLRRSNIEEFIQKARKLHGDKYDYSLVEYINNHTKIKIICSIHGIFEQTPNNHLKPQYCPICKSSKGEIAISKYLTNNNIEFIQEKRFIDCRYKLPLPFDFYLPKYNILIEFDGIQHFTPVEYFGGIEAFKLTQNRDKIKTEYCKYNNIKLIRIPFQELHNIKNIIDSNLKGVIFE